MEEKAQDVVVETKRMTWADFKLLFASLKDEEPVEYQEMTFPRTVAAGGSDALHETVTYQKFTFWKA